MKKVLIVTIFDAVPNYGNKLQNYASKKVLEKMGAQVSTLITEPQPSILVTYIILIVNRLSGYHLRDRLTHSKWKKIIKFHNFDKKILNLILHSLKAISIRKSMIILQLVVIRCGIQNGMIYILLKKIYFY